MTRGRRGALQVTHGRRGGHGGGKAKVQSKISELRFEKFVVSVPHRGVKSLKGARSVKGVKGGTDSGRGSGCFFQLRSAGGIASGVGFLHNKDTLFHFSFVACCGRMFDRLGGGCYAEMWERRERVFCVQEPLECHE